MTKRTFTSDLLQELEDAGVPKGVIAKKIQVAPSAVSALYAGERVLKYDEAMRLTELLPLGARGAELPLIGMAGAGNWLEAIEETRRHLPVPTSISWDFALEVVGDSMNLLLPDGSFAVISVDQTDLYAGKVYLLRNADGEVTIKRYRADPARFEPVSDNPNHQPFSLGSLDFRVLGRVTAGFSIL